MVAMTKPSMTNEMRRELRKAGVDAERAVAKRDILIRHYHQQGYTFRDIAAALETITHTAVWKIVGRATPETDQP